MTFESSQLGNISVRENDLWIDYTSLDCSKDCVLILLLLLLPLLVLSTLLFSSPDFSAAQVTFTKDKELVCRHAQCDLHTTTNILVGDEAGKENSALLF